MRRGPFVLMAVGAVVALLGVANLAFGKHPVARSDVATTIGSPTATAPDHAVAVPRMPTGTASPSPTSEPIGTVGPPPAARISIPRIGIRNAPIYERGVDGKGHMLIAPGYAVTHYAFSSPLGAGNAVLYGHDDIQGNIFGHLYDLGAGDTIQVTLGGQTQVYRVTGHQIVPPSDVAILNPTSDVRLTIITCWPYNVDTKRWIVTAIKA